MKNTAMQIAMILDRSGSMSSIEGPTVEGMNAFVADQQTASDDVSLLLVQFDDRYEQVFSGPVAKAPVLTLAENPVGNSVRFQPRGSTALLDAIGKTIDELGKKLAALPEDQRPGSVIVVIMTDGQENNSSLYNRKQIADLIHQQREVYKWQFQFLAANQDAITTASALNIPADNSITYAAAAPAVRSVMSSASRNVRAYRETGDAGGILFSRIDRKKAMEVDPDNTADVVSDEAESNQPVASR